MKTKHINSIIITILLILFSITYAKEYFLFHSEGNEQTRKTEQTKTTLSAFSFEDIKEVENVELYRTPDKNLLKTLVQKIGEAKTRVYVEAYIFTEKDLRSALVKAKKRGVDVKVLMEKNVYMANNINKKAYDEFVKNNIPVVWSDSTDYALNHSKYFIIDDLLVLSTGNWSYSMFTKNRDFMLFIRDKKILEKLLQTFNYDYTKERKYVYDDNLVLSPFFSREKLEFLIKNAKTEIKLYFPYFGDESFQSILEDKLDENVVVKIITDKKNENLDEFKSLGFDIKVLPKLTEHAKIILIDNKYLYIGSINFSTSSMDKNRETGILLKNENIIKKLNDFFGEDFK
ncbi:hypothetical protein EOM39_05405 [Candidatus Gracilibacteria bacterium]|nr:hypothetical protein [Candidatus Gracilibacteria bacterium]